LVADLSDISLRMKPAPEEFSALETICHLRDIEIEAYTVRINRIISEEEPTLPDIDGSRLAIERDYNSQNLDAALSSFTNARHANVETLRGVTIEQLSRVGIYQTDAVTLEGLLNMM